MYLEIETEMERKGEELVRGGKTESLGFKSTFVLCSEV